MGARIIRQGVVARTKARCHPHTGGEDQPDTATTRAAKANNNNKGGGNETPVASSVDKRLLPSLKRVRERRVVYRVVQHMRERRVVYRVVQQERGSKKRNVHTRQGGGSLRIPTSEEKQGWPTRAPPQCEKQGCRHQVCPTKEGFRSRVGITLPQHRGEHLHGRGVLAGELARA